MQPSLPSATERKAWIEKLRRLPDQLEYLVEDMTPDELTGHFIDGEWSVAQNIHHLADSHMNSYIRCKLILTEAEPPLKPYDQDRWAALPDAQMLPVTASLAMLRGLHARWVYFFESLSEVDWGRQGFHPENGLVTLADQARLYAEHGQMHMSQIRRTAAAQYNALPGSKEELLARIDREWARLNRLVGHIPHVHMELPLDDGWSPKVHLAHITGWENYLVDHAVGGRPVHLAMNLDADAYAAADMDGINALLEQRNRARPLDQVLADYQRVHAAARATVVKLNWNDWAAPRRPDEPESSSRIGFLAGDTYEHYLEHWQWLPVF